MSNAHWNRRQFLTSAVGCGAGLIILSNSRSARSYQANEKLNLAMIGAGGRGAQNLVEVADQNIVALCDVDQRTAGPSFEKYPQSKPYADYRRLLHELDQQIDAVVVSTTNHVHAPASIMAMKMGKHCYCEKPLAHNVYEARLAAHVADQHKVATQMGTQIHASDNFRRIVELIRGGAIGQVRECHCWLRGGGGAADRPTDSPPVPAGLDWDLWLGPAPVRPYHPCYVPHDWHYWWDFGGGAFGNMGCHYFDLAFWALELKHPATIEASGPPPHVESTPAQQHVRYEFATPAPGTAEPLVLTWTHGSEPPQIFQEHAFPEWVWGVFVGTEGMLLASYGERMLWPESKFQDYMAPAPTIPPSEGHHQEWINACKTGRPTSCHFGYGGTITEAVLLGNIAYRTGQKLQWDAAQMEITNFAPANDLLQRDYRKGWELA